MHSPPMKSRITLRMGKILEARTAPAYTQTHTEANIVVIVNTGIYGLLSSAGRHQEKSCSGFLICKNNDMDQIDEETLLQFKLQQQMWHRNQNMSLETFSLLLWAEVSQSVGRSVSRRERKSVLEKCNVNFNGWLTADSQCDATTWTARQGAALKALCCDFTTAEINEWQEEDPWVLVLYIIIVYLRQKTRPSFCICPGDLSSDGQRVCPPLSAASPSLYRSISLKLSSICLCPLSLSYRSVHQLSDCLPSAWLIGWLASGLSWRCLDPASAMAANVTFLNF